jgi:PAS domain S-box-containing protein
LPFSRIQSDGPDDHDRPGAGATEAWRLQRAAEAVMASIGDDFFRDLCDNTDDLIQSVTPDGRFLYANKAWHRILGYTEEDLREVRLFDVIHPSCRDQCAAILKEVMHGKGSVLVEAVFKSKDGRKVEVEGTASCRFESGKPVSTRSILRDVTERNEAREQLERLWTLSLDLLCVANLEGYFTQVNPAFEKLLGYSQEEILSRRFVEFIHPDDRAATEKAVVSLAEGRNVVDFQNRYMDASGRYRWLSWRSAAPSGGRGLIYAVARDVTLAKRNEEIMKAQAADLARSNTDLESFAYVASHDLRAPLRAIANLADWIEEDLPGETPPRIAEHLARLRGRLERLENLTGDLLEISRAGAIQISSEKVDTALLVSDLAEELAPPPGIKVTPRFGLPSFETARPALEQVLRNLIDNAIKHHDRPDGRIVVSSVDVGEFIEFTVADDGPGIPDAERSRIFDMFHRLRGNEQVEGTGIGLAMAKRIVERMGGSIRAQGASERGTSFVFTWPRKMPEPLESDAENPDRR